MITGNNEIPKIKYVEGGYIDMAVSIKPSPIIKGTAAKKVLDALKKPSDKSELFKKCEELSKVFTLK